MIIEKVKCLIIGSGPSGYTAAIYAARANMNPVLYQGLQPGGQLTTTNDVENFPGYPDGISGPEMMVQLQEQAKRFGTDVRNGWVSKVDLSGDIKKVFVNGNEIHCDTVIISTGANAKYSGVAGEKNYLELGGGVSACAVCDGFFYKGLDVVVVGAGDSACEEAHYLSKICNKVTMLVRSDFRASKIMVDRVKNTENIEILMNAETVEVIGDGQVVTNIKVKKKLSDKEKDILLSVKNSEDQYFNTNWIEEHYEVIDIPAAGFFLAIGHKPNTDIFTELELNNGYIVTKPGSTETNIPGVFAAGDVADNVYRQAITAAGTGCMAALDAERYLASLE